MNMESGPIRVPRKSPDELSEEEKALKEKDSKRLSPKSPFEEARNIVELSTEQADYKIVYSVHTRQNNPGDIVGSDAIILEYGIDYSNADEVINVLNKDVEDNQQYKAIIEYARANKIPIYFVDVSLKTRNEKDLLDLAKLVKKALIPVVGAKVSYALGKSVIKDMKELPINRRNFLKGLGKTMLAVYTGTPALEPTAALASTRLSHEPDEEGVLRKIERGVADINSSIHPELKTFSMEGRNALIAQKAESIAKDLESRLGKRPKLSVIIGALHTGIEKDLKMKETERQVGMRKYFTEKELDTEKAITRVDFRGQDELLEADISFSEAKM